MNVVLVSRLLRLLPFLSIAPIKALSISALVLVLPHCKSLSSQMLERDYQMVQASEVVSMTQAACANAPLFLGSTPTQIHYRVAGADTESHYQGFFNEGVAEFQQGRWRLSHEFGGAAPSCVRHTLELSAEQLLIALQCEGAPSCPKEAPQDFAFAARRRPVEDPTTTQFALTKSGPSLRYKDDDCEDPASNFHAFKRNRNKTELNCKHDTLYSWGPTPKSAYLRNYVQESGSKPFFYRKIEGKMKKAPLFSTLSPIGSHGYGMDLIRIRLKDGVRFVPIDRNEVN